MSRKLSLELIERPRPAPIPPLDLTTGKTLIDHLYENGCDPTWDSVSKKYEEHCAYTGTATSNRLKMGGIIVGQRISEIQSEGTLRLEAQVGIRYPDGRIYNCVPDVFYKNGMTIIGEVSSFVPTPDNPRDNFLAKCNRYKLAGVQKVLFAVPEWKQEQVKQRGLKGGFFTSWYFREAMEEFELLLRGKREAKDLLHRI